MSTKLAKAYPGKPWLKIPIVECHEPLVLLTGHGFAFFDPHPYVAQGAPYGQGSPWRARQGVVAALVKAQARLTAIRRGWRLMFTDTYRPNDAQIFMVEQERLRLARQARLDPAALTPEQDKDIMAQVWRLYSYPSTDPANPPLHSTGGAVDCTLANEHGAEVDMGSPVDENSGRSYPDHFEAATDEIGRAAHARRDLLQQVMTGEDFVQHRAEWWHFDLGDQYWAWHRRETGSDPAAVARYGRADLV